MGKRKGVCPSVRWSVFARDNFTCRYCGRQAGEEGVNLVIDHVVSVTEGGDNRIDNLVTACQSCNAGKAAKSLPIAPTTSDCVARTNERAANMQAMAEAMRGVLDAECEVRQEIVNMKCAAYDVDNIRMASNEYAVAKKLIANYGPDLVMEWYFSAASNGVRPTETVRYVSGCRRRYEERTAENVH